MSGFTWTLKADSPFHDVFPGGVVPVKWPLLQRFCLEGDDETRGYMADGDRLDSATMEAVAGRLAELRSARVDDIRDELVERGLPIRESSVAVHPALSMRFLL